MFYRSHWCHNRGHFRQRSVGSLLDVSSFPLVPRLQLSPHQCISLRSYLHNIEGLFPVFTALSTVRGHHRNLHCLRIELSSHAKRNNRLVAIPLAADHLPSNPFVIGVWFCPESPRRDKQQHKWQGNSRLTFHRLIKAEHCDEVCKIIADVCTNGHRD